MDDPRPGSVRVNGGPWMPCRFVLDGTQQFVDWGLVAVATGVWVEPGDAEVEIAVCPGLHLFGAAIVDQVYTRHGAPTAAVTVSGAGPLRGTR